MLKIFSQKKSQKGQDLVEYALILVLVAVIVIAILTLLGPTIGNVFSNIVTGMGGDQIPNNFVVLVEVGEKLCGDLNTDFGTVWVNGVCYGPDE